VLHARIGVGLAEPQGGAKLADDGIKITDGENGLAKARETGHV
jgi:hypothetical protein